MGIKEKIKKFVNDTLDKYTDEDLSEVDINVIKAVFEEEIESKVYEKHSVIRKKIIEQKYKPVETCDDSDLDSYNRVEDCGSDNDYSCGSSYSSRNYGCSYDSSCPGDRSPYNSGC